MNQIKVSLPDGSERSLQEGATIYDLAASIGTGLAKAAIAGKVDGNLVDLVLNGHDHDYERTKPMRGATPGATPADGTVYLVVGSAGAALYDAGSMFWTEKSEKTYNFVILKIRRTKLDMTAYRLDGTVLDSLTITKP